MKITAEMVKQARTDRGGFSKAQVKIAQSITGQAKWKAALLDSDVSQENWSHFVAAGKPKEKQVPVNNALPKRDGWHWKPQAQDVPAFRIVNTKKKKPKGRKAKAAAKKRSNEFCTSRDWLELRYRVIEKYGARCMACGYVPVRGGPQIHVDHIKPRSKYPHLALEFSNLQILCSDCNMGKSNKRETDWRPCRGMAEHRRLDNEYYKIMGEQ